MREIDDTGFAVQRKRPKIEKRFKITPKEIRLLRYWSKSEKISQSRFIEQAIEEFLKSIKL